MKKLILTLVIIALLSLTFVFAVSASECDFISSNEYSTEPGFCMFYSEVISFFPGSSGVELTVFYDGAANYYIRPIDFQNFVNYVVGININYSQLIEGFDLVCGAPDLDEASRGFFENWVNCHCGFDESYFNKLYYYKEITQEELDAKDEYIAGLENSIDVIDGMYQAARKELIEKDTQIESMSNLLDSMDATLCDQQSTINGLESENEMLQVDVESLETQVADLVNEKTAINSELMAMEAKLEREKAKSYLQGYEDADGFSWLPIIACLSLVSIFCTVLSIALRARKKKR